MIPVNKPFLPSKKEYDKLTEGIWKNVWLTNSGPLSIELEDKLKVRLGVNNVLFVSNGTMALQLAIAGLELTGEIITTPFSFIATTTSIIWQNCTPVFGDIEADTLNIDTSTIEELITSKTTGILVTHVYGNPCEVDSIEAIAKKYNLKVIYDGAHAFDVQLNNEPIFKHGDISICSLHASKLYHSVEGGLVACNDNKIAAKITRIRNFGFTSPESFNELGINGKNSEFHAAMGLINYSHIEKLISKRKLLSDKYDELLISFAAKKPVWNKSATKNYSYYPLIFCNEEFMLKCMKFLQENDVFTRRYFYPSLASALKFLPTKSLAITDKVSKKVLCLPLFYELTVDEVKKISDLMNKFQRNNLNLVK